MSPREWAPRPNPCFRENRWALKMIWLQALLSKVFPSNSPRFSTAGPEERGLGNKIAAILVLGSHVACVARVNQLLAIIANLVPTVLRLFGQRMVARRDSGVLEFYYRRIPVVKQWKPLRSLYTCTTANQENLIFFRILHSLSWRLPADQKA